MQSNAKKAAYENLVSRIFTIVWCGWRELNPHARKHCRLKTACLPFHHNRIWNTLLLYYRTHALSILFHPAYATGLRWRYFPQFEPNRPRFFLFHRFHQKDPYSLPALRPQGANADLENSPHLCRDNRKRGVMGAVLAAKNQRYFPELVLVYVAQRD